MADLLPVPSKRILDLVLQQRKRCRVDQDVDPEDEGRSVKIPKVIQKALCATEQRPSLWWENKKLVLVLDLDHTLLHSTPANTINGHHRKMISSSDDDPDLLSWDVTAREPTITKLRPYTRAFLNEASALFELYIYTMGSRLYAQGVAKFLDPDGAYFSPVRSKVISREDCTCYGKKDLDVVPRDERIVVIVDDTEEVWADNCRDNLIRIQRYDYYSRGRSASDKDDRALAGILDVLRSVYQSAFYSHHPTTDTRGIDIRVVLRQMRQQVLKGCKIIFSWVLASKVVKPVWKMAEQLGATCSMNQEGDASVTHVVSTTDRTDAARWALQSGKFLVTLAWVEASYYRWCRQQEGAFRPPAA